jgi:hypothetical protein
LGAEFVVTLYDLARQFDSADKRTGSISQGVYGTYGGMHPVLAQRQCPFGGQRLTYLDFGVGRVTQTPVVG